MGSLGGGGGSSFNDSLGSFADWHGSTIEDYTGLNLSENSAADRAVRAQREAADSANNMQAHMYDTTRADYAPWREAGVSALSQIQSDPNLFRSFNMSDYQADPGYAFRMSEGQKALERSAAARGGLNSGATLKALTRYGQDMGSQEYQNAYNRFTNDQSNRFNRLSGLAGLGQTATGSITQAGQNYANVYGQNALNTGEMIGTAATTQAGQTNRLIDQVIKAASKNPTYGTTGTGTGSTGTNFSDIRLKTDIHPVSNDDLRELRNAVKPYAFKYLKEEYGKGDYVGVMAQDLEKSKLGRQLVEVDENGHKTINNNKAISLLLAIFIKDESNAQYV